MRRPLIISAGATTYVTIDGSASPAGPVDVTGDVKPGTSLDFVTDASLTDATCSSAAVSGYVERGGAVTAGQKIGAIEGLNFSGCSAAGGAYTVEIDGQFPTGEWEILVEETPANPGDPVKISIQGVSANMHEVTSPPVDCHVDATATEVPGTFYPGAGTGSPDGRIVIDTPSEPIGEQHPLAVQPLDGAGNPVFQTCGSIFQGEFASMEGEFYLETVGATPGVISHG
ncbi:hypothetical protein FXB39_03205 [Nocardioides sp. BGMRC 2183]|nr:hypothetical protein FXB39_03205 [Nocardioides sp. BGMRC 2183]